MKQLVGQEFAEGTMERYQTSYDHTKLFLKEKYGNDDIELENLDYEFITEFEFWLKSVRKCGHNTTMKYLSNFRKIVFICVKNGWLDKDPFYGYKMTLKEVKRDFLTEVELEVLKNKDFSISRLERVRDIFLHARESTAESDELELLLVLVKDYEDKHIKIPEIDPIEAIKLKMEEQGLKNKDLEPIIGSKGHVSSVLSGRRDLTLGMAQRLRSFFQLPAEIFFNSTSFLLLAICYYLAETG